MGRKNLLQESIPYQAQNLIEELGRNLKTARLRRNLTLQEVADKIGVSRNLVAAAERGSLSSSISLYITLLWVYDLQSNVSKLADPNKDDVGLSLSQLRLPKRSRERKELDNEF